jgi:hypothetical protein
MISPNALRCHSERSEGSLFALAPKKTACAVVVLLLLVLAAPSFAGTVSGIVSNGTTGKPATGVEVILIQLQGGMQPVANTKTDSAGRYSFDNAILGTAPMLLRAVYRGVNYHEPIIPGKTTVNVQIFEPTDKSGSFAVTAHAIILQPNGSDLVVGEEYNVSNKTQPPLAYYRADGSFLFSIPDGAQLSDVSAVGSAGMPVVQSAIEKGKNEDAIAYAFRPGDSSVRVSYKLPYPGNQTTLRFASHYAVDRLAIFAPPTVQISGGGFTQAGQEQGFSVYMRESVAANTPITVSISGTAPVPQGGANSGSDGASAGAPGGGDDSQNPAVNSHVNGGVETPVASVTTLPARLDGLTWYIVAGFTALFALGLVYLWRQPQIAFASAPLPEAPMQGSSAPKPLAQRVGSASAASVGARHAVPAFDDHSGEFSIHTEAPRQGTASAPEASPRATAGRDLDREVRGSLDDLKDSLFRLELRREAGTIAEDDYIRERDRVQKVLRNLVKG